MTKRERDRLEKAIFEYGERQFECGEWDRGESEETWDSVYGRAVTAREKLDALLQELL